jgi:hypothetical protein
MGILILQAIQTQFAKNAKKTKKVIHKQAALSSEGKCLAGERIRGISFLMCIRPFLHSGHKPTPII